MAKRWIQLSTPLLLLLLLVPALAIESDFSFYPEEVQPCLDQSASQARCNESGSVEDLNACLCGNEGDFILNAASCIGEEASGSVDDTYQIMADACANSDTPMSVSQSEFFAAAEGDSPSSTTTTAPSSTTGAVTTTTNGGTTVTVFPTETSGKRPEEEDDDDQGLSTGATVGIGVGAAVVGVAAIAGLAIFLIRRRRRYGDESHPMLPQHSSMYAGPTTFPPREPSPGFDTDTKPVWPAAGITPSHSPSNAGSPDPRHSHAVTSSWGSAPPGWTGVHGQARYSGPYATPADPVAELPSHETTPRTDVFEMDGQQSYGIQDSAPRDPPPR